MGTGEPALRGLFTRFLEAYRDQPCLWQLANKDYYNKDKRNAAKDILLEILREAEPQAQRDDVLKKINSLRTSYKKERRKVLTARRAGFHRVPTLWCYPLLAFLDPPPGGGDGVRGGGEGEGEGDEHGEHDVEYIEDDFENDDNEATIDYNRLAFDDSEAEEVEALLVETTSKSNGAIQDAKSTVKRRKVEYVSIEGDTSHAQTAQAQGSEPRPGDRHDAYCGALAHKLRELPRHQRLLAERLINTVMFEAEWGALTRGHRLRPASP